MKADTQIWASPVANVSVAGVLGASVTHWSALWHCHLVVLEERNV